MILKLIHRTIILLMLISLLLLGSKIITYYKTGAAETSILQESLKNTDSTKKNIVWRNNDASLANPNITYALAKDLHSAWKNLNQSIYHQDEHNLSDYYHDDMIEKIKDKVSQAENVIDRHAISHDLELNHLSLDRSVAVIKDHRCVLVQREVNMGKEESFSLDTISYTAIFVFSDGLWKIKNWVQEDLVEATDSQDYSTTTLEENLTLIPDILGINYYAQDYPWHYFWDSTSVDIITSDFKIIKELGLNTVRIFIPYQTFSQFGKEEYYLQKLNQLMDAASTVELRVVPTLFDFPIGFDLLTYPYYTHHLNLIISSIKDHPALLAWNVKNEPDLDFEQHGKQKVIDWLKYTIDHTRHLDPNHPITISWSSINRLPILAEKLDFLSFHMYTDEPNWTQTINDYRSRYGKPIVLEEFGLSTREGYANLLGETEEEQRIYTLNIISEAKDNNIPWMLWTLYDFRQIPKGVFKPRPWIKSKQSHFGLIRKDGSKKELFEYLSRNN